MSTSLLYHAWGIRGYEQRRIDFKQGAVTFTIEQPDHRLRCPTCDGHEVWREGSVSRRWRTTPIGKNPVFVEFAVPRVWCASCQHIRQVKVQFADPQVRYTRSFERYALELSRFMTIKDVAQHLGVSWDVIKGIQKRNLQRRFRRIRLKGLERIAIDEISIGKRHRYLTVVLDLDSGAVVFIGEGKGADALEPFWKSLRASGAQIQAVASDMAPAYLFAVAENLPNAVHVLDRFHVMKLFNEKLSDLRREVQRTAETIEQKDVLKGVRWLLLSNAENLDETKNHRERLDEALRLNQPLATAYYLKEDLRRLWEQRNKAEAERFLDDWIRRAEASGVRMLIKFAKTLRIHRTGLLAWYLYPISTGPLEGTNTKIKALQRQAYGFRDPEFFRLKIHAIHHATYALVG